jgi:sterol desaturase/sphingolipid hydroxylase (fatty acid hydroxylase superfamily)
MLPQPAEFVSLAQQTIKGFLTLLLIFLPIELAFAQRSQPLLRPRLGEDVFYFVLNSIVPKLLITALVGLLVVAVRPIYASGIFHGMASLPLTLRVLLAIVVGDIGAYWGHRWSHEWPLLWHFHKIHHESEAMDWLVTSRAHPVDMVFTRLCGVGLIYLTGLAQGSLGQGSSVMVVYMVLGGFWGYFVHANLNWRFGFLENYIATPAYHHWHHSNGSARSINKNYAAIFPWIDRLFGSLYLPRRSWPQSYGLKVRLTPATPITYRS